MKLSAMIAAVGALLVMGPLAQAAVTVEIPNQVITGSTSSSTSGFFNVILGITGTGNGSLADWQAQVDLTSGTGMTLGTPTVTDVSPSPVSMALGTDNGFVTPINSGTLPNTSSIVSALQFPIPATSTNLDSDGGLGLMRVPFTVSAGSTGTFDLTINTSSQSLGTILSNPSGGSIAFTAQNGVITVNVPEPGSAVLMILGAAGLLARRRGKTTA
jgi:hypothetical protein